MNETKHPEPRFKLGDLVMLKSYASAEKEATNYSDQPKLISHHSPIMVITGIEIEDKKKKTHENELGEQIGERIKYHVTWFENKNSDFVTKVLYESFLSDKQVKNDAVFKYQFGKKCQFSTAVLERQRKLTNTPTLVDKDYAQALSKLKNMISFVSPPLLCTGIRKNEKSTTYHDQGRLKARWPDIMIKVMWFNYRQQKYSEVELAKECLID